MALLPKNNEATKSTLYRNIFVSPEERKFFDLVNFVDRAQSVLDAMPKKVSDPVQQALLRPNAFFKFRKNLLNQDLVSVMDDLEKLEEDARNEKLKCYLRQSFGLLWMDDVFPFVMDMMRRLPDVDNEILVYIAEHKFLYRKVDMDVRRKIWYNNFGIFESEVSAIVSQYLEVIPYILYPDVHISEDYFFTTEACYWKPAVELLAEMIGNQVDLFQWVQYLLLKQFLETNNANIGTVLHHLSLAMYNADSVAFGLPHLRCISVLHGCLEKQQIDDNDALKFIQSCLQFDADAQIYLIVLLQDPYFTKFVTRTLFGTLQQLVTRKGKLDFDNNALHWMLQLLVLWCFADQEILRKAMLESSLYTKGLLEALMKLMSALGRCTITPRYNIRTRSLSTDTMKPTPTVKLDTALGTLKKLIHQCRIGYAVALQYLLHLAEVQDSWTMERLLPILLDCRHVRPYEIPYMHSLSYHLIRMPQAFHDEKFCDAVCLFLRPRIHCYGSMYAMMNLACYVGAKLPIACRKMIRQALTLRRFPHALPFAEEVLGLEAEKQP